MNFSNLIFYLCQLNFLMKNKISVFFFCVVIIFCSSFFACKKYPQGPGLSLRSKTSRLCHNWKLTQFREDDTDRTAIFFQNYLAYQFNINKDGTMNIFSQTHMQLNNTYHTVQVNGVWQFSDNKADLLFNEKTILDNQQSQTIASYVQHDYIILKLYEKSIAVQENLDGHSFQYFFEPQ